MKILNSIASLLKVGSLFSAAIIADAVEQGITRAKIKLTNALISLLLLAIGVLLIAFGIGQAIDVMLNTTGLGIAITGLLLILISAFFINKQS